MSTNKPSKIQQQDQQPTATMVMTATTASESSSSSSTSSSSSPSRSTGTNDTTFTTASDRARAILETMKERRESLTSVLRNGSINSSGGAAHYASSLLETTTTTTAASTCNAANNTTDQAEGAPPSTGSDGSSNTETVTSHNSNNNNSENNNLITATKINTVRPANTSSSQRKLPPLFTPLESAAITKQLNDSLQQRRDRIFRMSLSGGDNSSRSSTCFASSSKVIIVTTSNVSAGNHHHHHQRVNTKSPHSQGTVATVDSSSTTDGVLSAASSSPDEACAPHDDEENDVSSSSSSSSADAAPAGDGGGSFIDGARQEGLAGTERIRGAPFLQKIKERLVESCSSEDVDTSMLRKGTSSYKAAHTSTDDRAISSTSLSSSSSRSCGASTSADSLSSPSSSSNSSSSSGTSIVNGEEKEEEEGQVDIGPVETNQDVGSSQSKRRTMQKQTPHEAASLLVAPAREDHPRKIIAARRIDGQAQLLRQQHESPSRSRMVPPAVVHCTTPCVVETLRMEKTDDMMRTNTPPKQARRQMEKDDTPHLKMGNAIHADVETVRKRLVEQQEINSAAPPKQEQQPHQPHQDGDSRSEIKGLADSGSKEQDEEDEEYHNCADYMPETYSPQKSKRKPPSSDMESAASYKALSATKRNISSQSISPQKSSSRRHPGKIGSPKKRIAGIALVQGHEKRSRLLQTLQKALADQITGNENNTEEAAAERQEKYQALVKTLQETVEGLATLYAQANLVAGDAPSATLESDGGGVDWIMSDESSFDCTTDGSNTSGWVSQEGESSKVDSVLQYNTDQDEEEEGGEGTDSDTLTDQSGSGSTSSGAVPMLELSGQTLEPVLEESVIESSTCSVEEDNRVLPSLLLISQERELSQNFMTDAKSAESKPAVIVLVSRQVQVCRAQGGLYKVASKSSGALNGSFSMTKNSPTVIVVRSVPVHRSEDYVLLSAEVRCGTHGSLLDLACQTSLDLKQYLAKKSELATRRVKLPSTTSSGRNQWRVKARGGHYHIAVWTGLCNDLILHRQLPPPALSLQQPDSSQKDLSKKGTTSTLPESHVDNGNTGHSLTIPSEIVTDEQCGAYGGLFHLATKTKVHEDANIAALSCSF